MFLYRGRKQEHLERTHANIQTPHRKAVARWQTQTQDLLAVRQQC